MGIPQWLQMSQKHSFPNHMHNILVRVGLLPCLLTIMFAYDGWAGLVNRHMIQ